MACRRKGNYKGGAVYYELSGTNVRIMGTVHVFPQTIKQLPRWTSEAIAWADDFALEMNRGIVGSAFEVPAESSSQALVSPDMLRRLEKVWPNHEDIPPLNIAPPWQVAMYLGSLGANGVLGVEHHLAASSNGREIRYLETPREFAAHMATIPLEDALQGISETLDDYTNNAKRLAAMYGDWQSRHLDTMHRRLQKKPIFATPSVHAAVLASRNRAWLPHIEALCATNTKTLVAVGALHLCGEDNLLALLGREVSPL